MPRAWEMLRRSLGLFGLERRCHSCAGVFPPCGEELFCPACLAALTRREQGFCPCCGELAAWPLLPNTPCGQCLTHPKPWQEFLFHGAYEGLLRTLLVRLKFHNAPQLGFSLGRLLAGHPTLAALEYECLVPVPLHKRRLAARGYNQAFEIARHLTKMADKGKQTRIFPSLLQRNAYSAPQTGLSTTDRKRNTQGIFQATSAVRGKKILLLDDIMTTGATLESAAKALWEAGAASVAVAVVARAPKRK